MDSTPLVSSQSRPTRWAALFLLVLACIQVGPSLWDAGQVQLALHQPARHLPWSAVLPEALGPTPAPDLSDQGMVFYPAYRQVAERWARGEVSLWNADIHAGVPSLANPQWGVLNPQVMFLGLLERLGGRGAFDCGLAWLALGRLFAAGLGAWLLARALGLSLSGAALVALTFQTSGFVVGWLGHSLGHVAPVLPWLLWTIERTALGARRWAPLGISLTALLTWLGGHPETAFFCLGAAALWAARLYLTDRVAGRRAGLFLGFGLMLAAPSIFPFVEYLAHSGARLARQGLESPAVSGIGRGIRLIALVCLGTGLMRRSEGRRILGGRILGGLILVATLWLVTLKSGHGGRVLLFLPGLHGLPGWGGHGGGGDFVEHASVWVSACALALACVSILSPSGPLRGRRMIAVGTLLALGLSLELEGIRSMWASIPVVGQGAGSRAAVISTLGMALLAGEGLGSRGRGARRGAGGVLALALLVMHMPSPGRVSLPQAAPLDSLHGLLTPLPSESDGRSLDLGGWVHRGVPFESLNVRVENLDPSGRPRVERTRRLGLVVDRDPSNLKSGAPPDSVLFSSPELEVAQLSTGVWTFTLEILALSDSGGVVTVGERLLGATRVELPAKSGVGITLWAIVILALWLGVEVLGTGGWVGLLLGLALLQGIYVGHGRNPATPLAEVFPNTRTTQLLRAQQEREVLPGRILGGPGVLPYNTGLVHGLVCLDGYDAMDVDTFDGFKSFAQLPGRGPLLDWNARGVDLDSPALRLLGCRYLATAAPMFGAQGSAEWEQIAGPDGAGEAAAEVYVYRATNPLARAFCVNRLVSREEVLEDPETFDPGREAFLEQGRGWSIEHPFETSSVEVMRREPERIELRATLDGEGLLVLCEQNYPGWRATVDGEEVEVWTVNSLLRGVSLESGEHVVVFEFRPSSWGWAWWVALLGLIGMLGVGRRSAPLEP